MSTILKAQPSAVSQRNPLDFVQQPRKCQSKGSTKSLSDTAKALHTVAAEARKQSNAALEEQFSGIFTKCEEQITHLSEKYKTPKYIHQVLENGARYTGKRGPSVKNAIRHHLSKKARESEYHYCTKIPI
jgi:translation initiation factor 2B subunit (eIF-2B alpha/beta/delta family)